MTSVVSKTSALRSLLIRAWRERWSDIQWGIHLKSVLPRGCSGDAYNLCGLILQQALVAAVPNQLVKHREKKSLQKSNLELFVKVLARSLRR
jgi:mediator of RNA polymerase II transcription subunit 24